MRFAVTYKSGDVEWTAIVTADTEESAVMEAEVAMVGLATEFVGKPISIMACSDWEASRG